MSNTGLLRILAVALLTFLILAPAVTIWQTGQPRLAIGIAGITLMAAALGAVLYRAYTSKG